MMQFEVNGIENILLCSSYAEDQQERYDDDDDEVFIGRDFEKTKSYSEKVAGTIDDEVKVIMDKAYDHCWKILSDNADRLQAVVNYLLEHESMTGEQFAACMEGREIGSASQTSMFDGFEE